MYTTLKEVLAKADKYNFTVGSFNTHNLEMLPYMIRAAKDMGSPISIQLVLVQLVTLVMVY